MTPGITHDIEIVTDPTNRTSYNRRLSKTCGSPSDYGHKICRASVGTAEMEDIEEDKPKTQSNRSKLEGSLRSFYRRHPVLVYHIRTFAAELVGTFLLVAVGTGAVASAVLTGALKGLWQVAVVWGCGIAMSIYMVGHISGAHLNPAVSFVMAVFGHHTGFKWTSLIVYVVAQVLGSFIAGTVQLAIWEPFILLFEIRQGIIRGEQPGCMRSGMIFGEYFPNPDMFIQTSPNPGGGVTAFGYDLVSVSRAMTVEAFGTGVIVVMLFTLTDRHNKGAHPAMVAPAIGATVAALTAMFAPVTQAGWNPARDFGPRLAAALGGWGMCAFGRDGTFWIYSVGPCIGALVGGMIYFGLLCRADEEVDAISGKSANKDL
ncbi:hypothetical protein BASA50_006541 [Batrachochytrium salamandrivorans]|uniref:Aquaporin n=1 Tax=Batrachochytrium salamandrivorans TaxID=1357716 RepID=A0ABQ8FCN1_9FUNG|nr:hypothetical protein BASA62_009219 [Batrachochytrium salamandrivorans]KAH6594592.1 hypothetical protein BASA50_006541 [Batrachochytrium salamandrivorans]